MNHYQVIEIDELAWHMDKDAIGAIIDARSNVEFRKGRIPGSRNFPSRQFANFLPNILDFIEDGVETLAIITKESNDSRDIMFKLLRDRVSIDIVFVNFKTSDWKEIGRNVEIGHQSFE